MQGKAYFLGCPTPDGFETRFGDEIRSGKYFTYIIKGGPGTGKSTLMKRLASELSDLDTAELYYCSSDPDSLDAVIFRKLGLIFVDGTSPHVFEPVYPGARERLLDLGRFWNGGLLRADAAGVIADSDENARLHQRAKRYLSAVHSLGAEIRAIGDSALLNDKLDGFATRFGARLFPKRGGEGKISLKQITSITPKGVMTQYSAFETGEVYVISDPYFGVTDILLKSLSARACDAGYDVVVSKNALLPGCSYEHMVVPELGISIVSAETADLLDGRKINALRFYDRDVLRERRRRFMFNLGARRELVYAAAESLARAKSVHDDLERHYIGAMDFEALKAEGDELIKTIRG